ncbi:MAG TPA: ABC transporter substrate-binding protein [Pyrinomonadaceae bacterium]|nr:ABC transporter substrate-binding protein [Pyrinomonadaceae bacterium]
MRVRTFTSLLVLSVSLALANCGGDITGVKGTRFQKPLVLKINAGSAQMRQYSSVMQNSLRQAGIPVEIEAAELNTVNDQVRKGQFQMAVGRWVGGNQDPIFLRDLFATKAPFNRAQYSNPELDPVLDAAFNAATRDEAREGWVKAQETISREIPMFPLWYADQMVIARRNVGNIKVEPSGDWKFMAAVTAEGKQGPFVVALESRPETFDQLRGFDASSERIRQLVYNTLMRKDEKFDYVGELATNVETSPDRLTHTFTLRDGVRFHNGKPLTAQDAKYTIETLLASNSPKAGDFFEGAGDARQPYVAAVEAPDARTLVIRLNKPLVKLFPALTSFGIIPQGSAETQSTTLVGTGPFRYVSRDDAQQSVDLAANESYFGGAPSIKTLRVRTILDANTLQAELKSGGVDLAVVANLQPDTYKALGQDPNLKVEQFQGSNVVYLVFNTQDEVVKDARVRQAVAYAIDREGIVRDLLLGQARVAHSILPDTSWAYVPGQTYTFNPEQSGRLLDEAGHRAQ